MLKHAFQEQNLLPFDGSVYLIPHYYCPHIANPLFHTLLSNLDWKQEKIFLYGRWVKVPRLMCWYGDSDANYRYSSVSHTPLTWIDCLLEIKTKIETDFLCTFNSVMANLYRNGNDSMGCHADNEKELGKNPYIASLSFGESRLIRFRHNQHKHVINLHLNHGDLLWMCDEIQHHWKHELPKTKQKKSERINLTFRQINPSIANQ